jgi:hypothetical protein
MCIVYVITFHYRCKCNFHNLQSHLVSVLIVSVSSFFATDLGWHPREYGNNDGRRREIQRRGMSYVDCGSWSWSPLMAAPPVVSQLTPAAIPPRSRIVKVHGSPGFLFPFPRFLAQVNGWSIAEKFRSRQLLSRDIGISLIWGSTDLVRSSR